MNQREELSQVEEGFGSWTTYRSQEQCHHCEGSGPVGEVLLSVMDKELQILGGVRSSSGRQESVQLCGKCSQIQNTLCIDGGKVVSINRKPINPASKPFGTPL